MTRAVINSFPKISNILSMVALCSLVKFSCNIAPVVISDKGLDCRDVSINKGDKELEKSRPIIVTV